MKTRTHLLACGGNKVRGTPEGITIYAEPKSTPNQHGSKETGWGKERSDDYDSAE